MSTHENDKLEGNINNYIHNLKTDDIKVSMNNSSDNDKEILNCVINQEHSHYSNTNEINENTELNTYFKISEKLCKIYSINYSFTYSKQNLRRING